MINKLFKHPLLKSGLIYTITDGINKSIPFLMLPLLSHYLLPEDYGIVSNYGVFIGVINLLIFCSIDGAIAVNYHRFAIDKLRIFIFNALIASGIFFLILVCSVILFNSLIFQYFSIPYSYQLIGVFTGLGSLFTSINLVLWRLEEKPLAFGIYEITNTILNVALSLYFVIAMKQAWQGRIDGIILSTILYGIFSMFFLVRRGYLKFEFNRDYLFAVMAFGIPLIPHSLSFWLRSGVDRMIITSFWGTEAVGLYATGFQFGILLSFLVGAFNNAFSPYLYKVLSNPDETELKNTKIKIVKLTYVVMTALLVFGLLFILLSKLIITYTFSKEYLLAVEYINWAILGQIFQGFYILFVNYIFFVKKTKGLAIITFSCAIIQVLLSYSLVRTIGPIGAAYSVVITAFINFVLVMFYSMKVFSMPWLIGFNHKATK